MDGGGGVMEMKMVGETGEEDDEEEEQEQKEGVVKEEEEKKENNLSQSSDCGGNPMSFFPADRSSSL